MDEERLNQLKLASHQGNLNSALRREANRPPVARREELELICDEILERRAAASADIKRRGAIIEVTRYTSTGKPFRTEVTNPNVAIATRAETQLVALSRLLSKFPPPKPPAAPGTAAAIFSPEELAEIVSEGSGECPTN